MPDKIRMKNAGTRDIIWVFSFRFLSRDFLAPHVGAEFSQRREPGHATDLIADESVRFIQAQGRVPFFLWVAFSVPHTPLQEEEIYIAPYRSTIQEPSRRLYAASVAHMDAAIGRLLKALEQTGQIPNTLILFTSDNGGQEDYASQTDYKGKHGPYARLGDNRPLRGWKGELYEGGIRVPALLCWKGQLAPRIVDQTISYLDWFPTLALLAGADLTGMPGLDGRNIWPLLALQGEIPPTKALYWNTGANKGLLDGDWKLIESYHYETVELFDLQEDPGESRDLSTSEPVRTKELLEQLHAWQKSVNAQVPGPSPGNDGDPAAPRD